MELRLLRYFLTVAKEQSFTKAAEQLHTPIHQFQICIFENIFSDHYKAARCFIL